MAGPAPKTIADYEKEWANTPLFMQSLPDADEGENVALEALQSLLFEDGPEETAASLKTQANEYFKARKYREAASFYTQALNEVGKDLSSQTKMTLYANRAACHLEMHNYRSCLRDCATALELGQDIEGAMLEKDARDKQRQTMRKALYRSARALIALEKLDEADDALHRLRGSGEPDVKLEKVVADKRADIAKKAAAKAAAAKKQQEYELRLKAALLERGLILPPKWSYASAAASCPNDVHPPTFDTDDDAPSHDALCFPVFILRPLAKPPTRDLVLEWVEDVPVSMHFDAAGFAADHEAYVSTAKGRLLKVGRKLSLKAIIKAAAKPELQDGVLLRDGWCLELYAVPKGEQATAWQAEMKRS